MLMAKDTQEQPSQPVPAQPPRSPAVCGQGWSREEAGTEQGCGRDGVGIEQGDGAGMGQG